MSISALDALVIRAAISRNPVTVQWPYGGTAEFELTGINRETMRDYAGAGGGYVADSPMTILGAFDWYVQDANSTAPVENDSIGVYCDSNGAPVSREDDIEATVVQHRIKKISRAAGGLTYELQSIGR